MLSRKNYYDDKKQEIKLDVISMIDSLEMLMEQCRSYLKNPSIENRSFLLNTEDGIDEGEKEIESYILDLASIQNLNVIELKWLFTMSRIVRELERCGDQITNVMTICNESFDEETKTIIEQFFIYENNMVHILKAGFEDKDIHKLENLIKNDFQVNELNRDTYELMTRLMDHNKIDAKLGTKIIVVSRFLERFGDHLVNAGKLYKKYIIFEKENERIM